METVVKPASCTTLQELGAAEFQKLNIWKISTGPRKVTYSDLFLCENIAFDLGYYRIVLVKCDDAW